MAITHIHSSGGDFWRVTGTKKYPGVTIDVDLSQIQKCMRRCREKLPKIRAKSWAKATGTLHKQLQMAMSKGGDPARGVPKFKDWEDFTKSLRKFRGWKKKDHKMGGVLADRDRIVTHYTKNFITGTTTQYFGWPDKLRDVAVKFQDGEGDSYDKFQDVDWRHYCHRIGFKDIPAAYVHNPRPVIAPFKKHAIAKVNEWAKAMIHKTIAGLIAREARKAMK